MLVQRLADRLSIGWGVKVIVMYLLGLRCT